MLDEVRAIARTGLHYSQSPFDRDRYQRLLELAADGYAERLAIQPGPVRERFLAELGHITTKVGADAAVFDDEDRILLVRRTDDGLWGMVAGWVEPGEHPEHTVVRELREEIGVGGRVDRLVGVYARPASATYPHGVVAVVYLCTLATADFRVQPHEILECGWFDVDAVTDWHGHHEAYARAARDAWRRGEG